MELKRYTRVVARTGEVDDTVTLPMELRQRSRQRARLDRSGEAVALKLPRGTVLRGGDMLEGDDGSRVAVVAAPERLSVVVASDPLLLSRVAYHLGNRHVPVEIGRGWLHYREDHVLDGMVEAMGVAIVRGEFPFEPEVGAYHGHHHSSAEPEHQHEHDHRHHSHG